MYEKFGQFIAGKWSPSENKETYEVINPATEEVLGHASKATPVNQHPYDYILKLYKELHPLQGLYFQTFHHQWHRHIYR